MKNCEINLTPLEQALAEGYTNGLVISQRIQQIILIRKKKNI